MELSEQESRRLIRFAPALFLLALSILVNYVDRGNLSTAAPLLKEELHVSASELGILFSSFFWTYTALQFYSGWLVDRFDVNWVIAAGYLLWSLATIATGFVQGFIMLLVMRLLLGVGESIAFPACSKILALHLPERDRGFANGAIIAGMKCGPAVGTFGAGLMMARYGWRPTFIAIGLISLLWLPPWIKWMPRAPKSDRFDAFVPGFRAILRQRSFWGTSAGQFCGNYLVYFLITWLPFYLVRERHLSIQAMTGTAGLYYLVDAASAMATGWLADRWIRSGRTATFVRKFAMGMGYSTAALALPFCAAASAQHYLPWLMLAGVGCGMGNSGTYAFPQTLAGPQAAGRWTGLQNGFANLAGVVGPALTGFVLDWTQSFVAPFAITAAMSLAGALAWVFAVGKLEPVKWAPEPKPLLAVGIGTR